MDWERAADTEAIPSKGPTYVALSMLREQWLACSVLLSVINMMKRVLRPGILTAARMRR